MGITGLLPFLKEAQREVNVSSFRGRKVAVDAYCWLHRGAYSCAMQLVMKSEKIENLPFIKYCMKRVNMLLRNDITPIMVFDGSYLPTKANTEKERRDRRHAYLAKGKELLKLGKKSEAVDCFQKSVDVSHEMALALIKECRRVKVECIVAPYEADAQLAYLEKEGIVDVVITEDSDLLVFGCKRVLFKMDDAGNGKLIDLQRDSLGKANKNLIGFTQDSFRQMCIFSGCDYLASVPGVGLSKATKLMRKYGQNPERVIRGLRVENSKVPKDYDINFKKAEWTFLYQLVFDPRSQGQVRLNSLPEGIDPKEIEFAGVELMSPKKVVHMARGNIDPISMKTLDTYSPSKAPPPPPLKSQSWTGSAMGTTAGKQYPLSVQAKLNLSSSARSKGQFKPPKRSRPIEETDNSTGDDELLSIYDGCGPSATSTSDHMFADGWLTKRRKCDTSQVCLSSESSSAVVSQYFGGSVSQEEGAEHTPGLEGGVALNAARRLKLKEDKSPTTHSPPSPPLSQSPRQLTCSKSSRTTSHNALSQVQPEASARKQLFSRDTGNPTSLLNRFKFVSSKPSKVVERSPFEILDKSQTFVSSEEDSESKRCFMLTGGPKAEPEESSLLPQVDDIITIDEREDTPPPTLNCSPLDTAISSEGTFPYFTSSDLISAHPGTLGQSSVVPSQTRPDQPHTERRGALPCVDIVENTSVANHRPSLPCPSKTALPVASSSGPANGARQRKHLGLSRRPSSKSNSLRSVDSTLKQTKLGHYNYTRRPQM